MFCVSLLDTEVCKMKRKLKKDKADAVSKGGLLQLVYFIFICITLFLILKQKFYSILYIFEDAEVT